MALRARSRTLWHLRILVLLRSLFEVLEGFRDFLHRDRMLDAGIVLLGGPGQGAHTAADQEGPRRDGGRGAPSVGVDGRALQCNVTHEYFIKKVQNILILYFSMTGMFHYCNMTALSHAEFFIRAMGIEPCSLFGGS